MRADGVFAGGGVKGIAFTGALQAATEAGYDEWVNVAGTSAGAITAMTLAVGYDPATMRERFDAFDLAKIADYGGIGGVAWPLDMLEAILDTSMNAFDKLEMKAFGNRTVAIPTGDVSTLDFALAPEQQQFLYDCGYQAGKTFFAANPKATNMYGATPP